MVGFGVVFVYDICPLSLSSSLLDGERRKFKFWVWIQGRRKKESITPMEVQVIHYV